MIASRIRYSSASSKMSFPTPMRTAWDIHKAWPEAEFHVVSDAGHASSEAGIVHELIEQKTGFLQKVLDELKTYGIEILQYENLDLVKKLLVLTVAFSKFNQIQRHETRLDCHHTNLVA